MGSIVLQNSQERAKGLWIIKFPDFHGSYPHQQLYITGKKIILEGYWLIGKGNSEGGTLRIAKCLTADKKLGLKFTSPVAR
jgi:hypothetical protein